MVGRPMCGREKPKASFERKGTMNVYASSSLTWEPTIAAHVPKVKMLRINGRLAPCSWTYMGISGRLH